jgi:hypothetical protein
VLGGGSHNFLINGRTGVPCVRSFTHAARGLAADSSIDLALSGLEAALRGDWLRQPVERTEVAAALPEAGFETEGESSIELRDGTAAGGHGARNDLLGLEATFRRLKNSLVELGEGNDPERVPVPPTLKRVFDEVRARLLVGRD